LSLCRHADIDKQTCFPSEELIAEENNVGETTVKNSIKKLEKLGLISVFRSRRTNGTRNVNIYTLLYILKWEHQPETTDTVDIINEPPESNNSESQSREVSNKETHSIKETNNKEDIFKKEKCNNTDFKKFFENYKPDWIK
jgi:DNA-binding Lrp family transcriptional regulator